MPAPYIPLDAVVVLIASLIVITLGIIYTVRISKRFTPDDPRLKWRINVAAIVMVIAFVFIIAMLSMTFGRDFINPETAMRPVPGKLTDLVLQFAQLTIIDHPYEHASLIAWLAGGAAIGICMLRWPYGRTSKKVMTESDTTTNTQQSGRHAGPKYGPTITLSVLSLRILIPILAVASIISGYTADHIKKNPTDELIAAKNQALAVQIEIHATIYQAIPDNAVEMVLHNPPKPYAEGVITESRTTGRGSRPNGKAIIFSSIPQISVDPFIGPKTKGSNANWQTLRWAQAVAYGLKPQATITYRDGGRSYYEATYDASGSMTFTRINIITHFNN